MYNNPIQFVLVHICIAPINANAAVAQCAVPTKTKAVSIYHRTDPKASYCFMNNSGREVNRGVFTLVLFPRRLEIGFYVCGI